MFFEKDCVCNQTYFLYVAAAGRSLEDYNRLLHVVIVGGGPTGVEVAGELSNLINRDLKRIYPDRAKAMR